MDGLMESVFIVALLWRFVGGLVAAWIERSEFIIP